MAVLSSYMPTLIDVARILDPNGKVSEIANIISTVNDIVDDIPWIEGNLPTGHQITQQTSRPTPVFRLLNAGVVPTKPTTGQVVESCGMLEARSSIDKNVAEINGNTAAFRMAQDKPMIEAFGSTLATALIYGDVSTNPEQFNGLATRYFSLGTTYQHSANMIDAGGTGSDNMSIWLVGWGENKIFGIYPKGTKAGITHEDLGLQEVITSTTTGAVMRAYVSWMQWLCGIAVADYRYAVRICNIDKSALITASDGTDTSANILKYMSMAIDILPTLNGIRPVFYMNNTARSMLRVKMADKTNLALREESVTGSGGFARRELSFYGVPCRKVDALTIAEATITTATT